MILLDQAKTLKRQPHGAPVVGQLVSFASPRYRRLRTTGSSYGLGLTRAASGGTPAITSTMLRTHHRARSTISGRRRHRADPAAANAAATRLTTQTPTWTATPAAPSGNRRQSRRPTGPPSSDKAVPPVGDPTDLDLLARPMLNQPRHRHRPPQPTSTSD